VAEGGPLNLSGGSEPAANPSVLYIGGTGRSGSTLVSRLLHRYDGFVAVGELRYVWERSLVDDQLCGCGLPFTRCPFWTEVFGCAFGGFEAAQRSGVTAAARRVDRLRFIPLLAEPRLRPAAFARALDEYASVSRRLYSAILSVAGARVVVDSSKDPSYAFLLCATPALDVSVVHVIRDSRAVAFSWMRTKVRPEIHWEVAYMQRRAPARSATRWLQDNLLLDALGRRHPRFLRIRYEDLVDAVEPTMDAVGSLPSGAVPAPSSASEEFPHSMSGNPMRFQRGEVLVTPDMAWRRDLAPGARTTVTCITAPLLRSYGYLGRGSVRGEQP